VDACSGISCKFLQARRPALKHIQATACHGNEAKFGVDSESSVKPLRIERSVRQSSHRTSESLDAAVPQLGG
jgi:hypothetical protein